jgi:hypothetical protein
MIEWLASVTGEEYMTMQAVVYGFLLKVVAFMFVSVALNVAHHVGMFMLGIYKSNLMETINHDPKAAAMYHGLRYLSFAMVAALIFG